jgi:serine/threonine protein kinase
VLLSGQKLLEQLLTSGLVRQRDWEELPPWHRQRLSNTADSNRLLDQLLTHELLTGYQAGRIRARKPQWLMLGKYRVLDRLGAGSLGVVFKAEHIETRELVAIKVLVPAVRPTHSPLLSLLAERQTVAQVQHPNIVGVLDVCEATSDDPDCPTIYYYVMDYVTGQDLEQRVQLQGRLPPAEACLIASQVTAALAAAHEHKLVHSDLKPSNILLADHGPARLLDFGLARGFRAALGDNSWKPSRSEFLAPEQADGAASMDIRTDLYSLGAVLYWSMTTKMPFAGRSGPKQSVPLLKDCGVEAPHLLQPLLDGLLAYRPEDRPAQPSDVLEVLAQICPDYATPVAEAPATPRVAAPPPPTGSILVIDHDEHVCIACKSALEEEGLTADLATVGKTAMEMAVAGQHDVLLLAAEMPGLNSLELLQHLRKHPPRANLKIIMLCARVSPDAISQVLTAGADDYLTKPVDALQLRTRVTTALHLQQVQLRAEARAVPGAAADEAEAAKRSTRRRGLGGWLRPLVRLFGA